MILLNLYSVLFFSVAVASITIPTSSGQLQGVEQDGVMSFKGIRFAQPPTGERRWQPPLPFISRAEQDATKLGPSCVQQFAFETSDFIRSIFNTPPPPEAEDCLFLNVWAPSGIVVKKPVLVWIYGGGFSFGTGSLPAYDGTSIASNQDVVVVTFNYRTNVFGFPAAPDLPPNGNNLGLLDQELALLWVQLNIRNFGGDPSKVTIMGQSAGGASVATAIGRHRGGDAPFRAGIMLSGSIGLAGSTPTSFNQFADAVGCTQSPGPARLACLKAVPADTISKFVNGPDSGAFGSLTIDNATVFARPLERTKAKQTARVPILLGSAKDDASVFTFAAGVTNLTVFLDTMFGNAIPGLEQRVRTLYPNLNDTQIITAVETDIGFKCTTALLADATVTSGIADVYRYIYGAVFTNSEFFPGAGATHASELPYLFGTFDHSNATPEQFQMSATFQTTIADFVKNPAVSPAPRWAKYGAADGRTRNVAELAFMNNFRLDNVVQLVANTTADATCVFWDPFIVGGL